MYINNEMVDAFNSKPRVDINNIKKMSASQLDSVKTYGSAAENLLKNKDFALFVHHFKFDQASELSSVIGHKDEDNAKRVAVAHNIAGVEKFVESLQRAVFYKNQAVSIQSPAT
jgi:hypothetical protein